MIIPIINPRAVLSVVLRRMWRLCLLLLMMRWWRVLFEHDMEATNVNDDGGGGYCFE